jgi:hypothetical protein
VANLSAALSIGTHVDGRARYREQKDHYLNLLAKAGLIVETVN